ncbi:MAG: PASTA domain-containing protein [candidate division Zixibacteria bacterium]|nr:PASTA domain-containing protein [Candidatus Tariuqbacter arcticus]
MESVSFKTRLIPLALFVVLSGIILIARLFQIQVILHPRYDRIAAKQHEDKVELLLPRGRIYDRRGVILGLNVPRSYSYAVHPGDVKEPLALAGELARLTGMKKQYFLQRLRSESDFVWLIRQLDSEKAQRLRNVPELIEEWETRRFYPFLTNTPKAVGFTDRDGKGIAGLELVYDEELSSIPGWENLPPDKSDNYANSPIGAAVKPIPGANLILTFDNVIHNIVSREINNAVNDWRAKAGMALVMLPRTGEILSMVSTPAFDPNSPGDFIHPDRRIKNIVDMFEPGSVFKIVPLIAALRSGISPSYKIHCENGRYKVGDCWIKDTPPRGTLSLEDIIVYSSNIGIAKIDSIVGAENLYETARDLGFGCPTGIEIPAEVSGILTPPAQWDENLLASIGFGQGVSVSALQIACAYGAIANDGVIMKPRIVKAEIHPNGRCLYSQPVKVRRAASRKVAEQATDILVQVVKRGTGTVAQMTTVTIAGKTSTAQKPISKELGYSDEKFISAFIGYTLEEPRLLCLVVIDEPKDRHYGGLVAAPIFKNIMKQVIPIIAAEQRDLMGPVEYSPKAEEHRLEAPDFVNMILEEALILLKKQNTPFKLEGSGEKITAQIPYPGQMFIPGDTITVFAHLTDAKPKLKGLTVRLAAKRLISAGYSVKIHGAGIVQSASFSGKNCTLYAKTYLTKDI